MYRSELSAHRPYQLPAKTVGRYIFQINLARIRRYLLEYVAVPDPDKWIWGPVTAEGKVEKSNTRGRRRVRPVPRRRHQSFRFNDDLTASPSCDHQAAGTPQTAAALRA